MRRCTKCRAVKDAAEFYQDRQRPNGARLWCKACDNARMAEYVKRPGVREAQRVRARKSKLARSYGITVEQYDAMLDAQGGGCAICRCTVPIRGSHPVDHDHLSGAVRGILCDSCNVGLARFGDDPERLIAAAAYLLSQQDLLAQIGGQ